MKYTTRYGRTFWAALTEWLKWRPRHMLKKCPMCGKEWKIWASDMYYISGICSTECQDAAYVEEWGIERDRKE